MIGMAVWNHTAGRPHALLANKAGLVEACEPVIWALSCSIPANLLGPLWC